jgi:hypothetical protein
VNSRLLLDSGSLIKPQHSTAKRPTLRKQSVLRPVDLPGAQPGGASGRIPKALEEDPDALQEVIVELPCDAHSGRHRFLALTYGLSRDAILLNSSWTVSRVVIPASFLPELMAATTT